MRKWSTRSLNNLKGIHPCLRRVMDQALQESPLDFIVIEGLRSVERQKELVASGASKTMNSRHITGHAVDIVPIGPNGPRFDWPLYHQVAPTIKRVAKELDVDLEWGGDWKTFKDGPHFQLSWEKYPVEDWTTDTKPKERTVVETKTGTGAAVTTGSIIASVAADAAETAGLIEPYIGYSEYIKYLFLGVAFLGIALTIYGKIDSRRFEVSK